MFMTLKSFQKLVNSMNYKLMYKKTDNIWLWTAVDHFQPGILGWVLGDHSSETFESLWNRVSAWKCYFYVTDGWPVYPMFISDEDHIISKTYMTLLRRGKYEVETLSGKATSQDSLLF